MGRKNELFSLINSLKPAEKRFFKTFANRNPNQGKNNYLRLFEAVDQQATYDEVALKAQFSGQGLGKNFANVKNYLYRMILRAMRAYDSQKNPRKEVQCTMEDSVFLWKKGLYDQSVALSRKALAKARRIAAFDLEIEILQQLRLEQVARKVNGLQASLRELDRQSLAALRRHAIYHRLQIGYYQVFALARKRFESRDATVKEQLREILSRPELQIEPKEVDFFQGKMLLLKIQAVRFHLTGEHRESLHTRRETVKLWEEFPEFTKAAPTDYLISLGNLLAAGNMIQEYCDFETTLNKMRAHPAPTFDTEGECFQNASYFELLYRMNQGELDKALASVPEIEAGLSRYAIKINHARLLAFRYNLMMLHFVCEEFSLALQYLNLIVHDKASEHREDIQQMARLMLLILHYELGNTDLMEYLYRSAYRYFYKRKRLHVFEQVVFRFLRKIATLVPGPTMRAAYQGLLAELNAMDGASPRPPAIDELRYWLRSRIEDRSLREIAQYELKASQPTAKQQRPSEDGRP